MRTELWGLVAPASGVHQITVTITSTAERPSVTVVAGSQSFSGVDQIGADRHRRHATAATTATPAVTVTNSAYDYVVDSVAFNGNTALSPRLSARTTATRTTPRP